MNKSQTIFSVSVIVIAIIAVVIGLKQPTEPTFTEAEMSKETILKVAPNTNSDFEGVLPGDVTRDGKVNIADLSEMTDLLISEYLKDYNGDGKFNYKDVDALQKHLFEQQ